MNKHVIIVAGGMGQRMQAGMPKQMIPVAGKEIIIHTIEKFRTYDPSMHITLVIHDSLEEAMRLLLKRYDLEDHVSLVKGGNTRFQSVKQGLNSITARGVVGIHDAARPLVSIETIARCYDAASQAGNAIPVMPVNESLREVSDGNSKATDRNRYKIVQTPQCFDLELVKRAFEQDYSFAFTDDATVLESMGEKIHLVEGNIENIKITYPHDLQIAELLLK